MTPQYSVLSTSFELHIGQITRPYAGESVCGDAIAVVPTPEHVTIALADGLGHGAAAAEASQRFCTFVQTHPQQSLQQLLDGAAAHLKDTRGAAVALLRLSLQLEFSGVGNIQVQSRCQQALSAISVPGILGYRKVKTRVHHSDLSSGDIIAVYSDGIAAFDLDTYGALSADAAVRAIASAHGKNDDDVSCVVVKCIDRA